MDFSNLFSRKNKKQSTTVSAPSLVKPKGRELAIAEITQEPLEEQHFESETSDTHIVVTEINSNFPPGVEDAAMLYANGRISETANLLQMFLVQMPEEDSLWMMLFDLYAATGQKEEFEQLAVNYAMKREQSPPPWPGTSGQSGQSGQAAAAAAVQKTDSGQLFSLKGPLDRNMADRLQLMLAAAASGTIQLDLSGIDSVTSEGCALLRMALVQLQRQQVRLQIASGALVGLLQQYVAKKVDVNQEYWLLLLQIYQLQGKMAEFEDLAVEYAMQFEVSPPSWEAPKLLAQVVAPPPTPEPEAQSANVYALHGIMGSGAMAELNAFKAFAAAHQDVVLDLSAVERIEFSSVSMLMDALIQLSSQGKQVTVLNSNLLIYVLLVIMGIDQIATVVRNKLP